MKRFMSEKKTALPSLRNQYLKAVKEETKKKKIIPRQEQTTKKKQEFSKQRKKIHHPQGEESAETV